MCSRKKLQKKETSVPIPKKYLEYEVSQGGVVRGSTLIETAHPGQAPFAWVVLWQEILIRNTELISHHQPEELRKGRKETLHIRPLPRIPLDSIHLGWAMQYATRKDSELEWSAKDHPTNPITIKPENVSHAAEQFSWVPLSYCSPPRCPSQ